MSSSNEKRVFIERRAEGDYAIRKADAKRASATAETQKAAIEKAKELHPGVGLHVERVRNTSAGHRDKWRKA